MKKIIIFISIIGIVLLLLLVPLRKLNENDFELLISVEDTYSYGETITVTATLHYKDSMFKRVEVLNQVINLTINENDDVITYPLISSFVTLTPFCSISESKDLLITSYNSLYVTAYTSITVNGKTFNYTANKIITIPNNN